MLIFHGMLRSHNFGDVLLAQLCLRWIREVTDEPIGAMFVQPELRILLELRPASFLDLFRAKAAILSGGGYFQIMDRGFPALKRFARIAGPILTAQLAGRPTAIVAVGVGPVPRGSIPDMLLRSGIRRLFSHADIATVRDKGSFDAVAKLKVSRSPVETADLVFSMTKEDLPICAINYASEKICGIKSNNIIGIQLSFPVNHIGYENIYASLLDQLSRNPDTHCVLLEDHSQPESGQKEFQRYMAKELGRERSTVVPYENPLNLAALLARLDAVLTDKLHVGLVAAAMGTAPFSIAKHAKNISAYHKIGVPENCILLSSASAHGISALIGSFLQSRGEFIVSTEVRNAAVRNREVLQSFLR
ncbi:polysaccharide pyruvyl transferase family protein [Mesorhizobium escarrei]|uniref:Polysaccharide pyruvyl transferase domain-containing protein n=1 Tax=Mesorhizobium escarrei TaxID=666018 RepID=A0ABN8KCR2_9HYPH|nr:polysaccharide pyruvyl transferase family protein [Mesorhizobium escarrei]CAH2406472.1 hypothetical protein MES5069_520142 [Mesorhizobium escarrei]